MKIERLRLGHVRSIPRILKARKAPLPYIPINSAKIIALKYGVNQDQICDVVAFWNTVSHDDIPPSDTPRNDLF